MLRFLSAKIKIQAKGEVIVNGGERMIKTSWIDNMTEGMTRFSKAMTNCAIEIGKQTAYDIIGVPPPSRWQRIESRILEFIIRWW